MNIVVLTTCPSQEIGQKIATALIENKLAACVNMISGVQSMYHWQGQVQCDHEIQLVIKTTENLFEELSQTITAMHPYDVPEIIALNIQQGNKQYLDWITESVKREL